MQGNNAHCIEILTEDLHVCITFEEALLGASNVYLHPDIRTRYVEILSGNNTDYMQCV